MMEAHEKIPRTQPAPMSREQLRASDMMYEGGAVGPLPDPTEDNVRHLVETEEQPGRFRAWLESVSESWGRERLRELFARKGQVSKTMQAVPSNMHRVANQTQLALELIDDFRAGTYRQISWFSVALLVGAVLYAVSPADVIPDALPLAGQLDDLALLGIVTRIVNRDLRAYCAFKGYDESEYFRVSEAS